MLSTSAAPAGGGADEERAPLQGVGRSRGFSITWRRDGGASESTQSGDLLFGGFGCTVKRETKRLGTFRFYASDLQMLSRWEHLFLIRTPLVQPTCPVPSPGVLPLGLGQALAQAL